MSVRIKLPAMFQQAANGAKMVEVEASECKTVGECLKYLRNNYPGLGKMLFDEGDNIAGYLNVFVNGQGTNHNQFTFPIKDGDEVYPIMMIEGG